MISESNIATAHQNLRRSEGGYSHLPTLCVSSDKSMDVFCYYQLFIKGCSTAGLTSTSDADSLEMPQQVIEYT